jgi:hypothetical protein
MAFNEMGRWDGNVYPVLPEDDKKSALSQMMRTPAAPLRDPSAPPGGTAQPATPAAPAALPPRRDENGYVPGSYAAQHPIIDDKQKQLDRLLEDYNRRIEQGTRTGGGAARDADMRRDLISSVETGLALEKERPGQGMNIDDALARLSAGAETNRLQYATTNSGTGARLAGEMGLPDSLPSTRGEGGGSYKLADAWGTVNEQTQKQSLTLDQILHPEKYREEQVFNQGSLGLTKLDKELNASTIPGTAKPEKAKAPPEPADTLKETPVGFEYGGKVYSYSAYGKGSDGRIYQRSELGDLIGAPGSEAAPVSQPAANPTDTIDEDLAKLYEKIYAGNKKPGLDWVLPNHGTYAQMAQALEAEKARLLSGGAARAPATKAPAQQPKAVAVSPVLQNESAVQWAKANPKDPRSAEILKRNGM